MTSYVRAAQICAAHRAILQVTDEIARNAKRPAQGMLLCTTDPTEGMARAGPTALATVHARPCEASYATHLDRDFPEFAALCKPRAILHSPAS